MSVDPAGFGLVNPMEQDSEGKLRIKSNYSLIEGLNWYSYVSNNPVKYVDPTGMDSAVMQRMNGTMQLEKIIHGLQHRNL